MIRNDTDYALRMLLYLAEQFPRAMAASELAAHSGVPRDFAQKILRKLAAAEILRARAGRRGGFNLIRPPGAVSLMDAITAIQGRLLLNRCMGSPIACARRSSCRIASSLKGLQNKLDAFVDTTSLSDILGYPAGSVAKTANPTRRPCARKERHTRGRAMR